MMMVVGADDVIILMTMTGIADLMMKWMIILFSATIAIIVEGRVQMSASKFHNAALTSAACAESALIGMRYHRSACRRLLPTAGAAEPLVLPSVPEMQLPSVPAAEVQELPTAGALSAFPEVQEWR